jgi:thiamine monophosphate synthase
MITINGVELTPRQEATIAIAVSFTGVHVGAGSEESRQLADIIRPLTVSILEAQGADEELSSLLDLTLSGEEASRILNAR